MNENVGKNIKRWARVLFIVFLVVTGIALFSMFIAVCAEDEDMFAVMFFLLPPIGALGYCIVRVSMLVLYGFGELVDRAVSQDNKMPKLKYVSQTPAQPAPKPVAAPTPAPAPAPVAPESVAVPASQTTVKMPAVTVCTDCGGRNPADAKFCEHCGSKIYD